MNDEVSILEKQLEEISIQLKEFEKQRLINTDSYCLYKEKRIIQRKLSIAKNQETAILIDYPYPWDTGAPLPHVISNGYKTFLIYYVGEHNSKWNPSNKNITDLNTGHDDITALVKFINCYNYKFGGINDEVIHGHPLYKHGLEAYEAHIIINSKWLKEQESINSVHSNYSHTLWENYKHYIFTFHDEIFECIASDYKVDIFKGRICSVFSEATNKLFE